MMIERAAGLLHLPPPQYLIEFLLGSTLTEGNSAAEEGLLSPSEHAQLPRGNSWT